MMPPRFCSVRSSCSAAPPWASGCEQGEFVDRWRLRRGGRLVFAETVRLDGNIGAKLARSAVAKGGAAIGTALIVPGDEALIERIREAADSFAGEVGISAWNGFAMARFCAQDAARLARRHDGRAGAHRRGAAAAVAELMMLNYDKQRLLA